MVLAVLLLPASLLADGFSVRIDCGQEEHDLEAMERERLTGAAFEADRSWREGTSWGSVGGEPVWDFFPWYAEGTHIPDIYRRRREGVRAYKFNLPSGDYILTLGFLERRAHCPGMRRFSVSLDGRKLIRELDIFALAGLDRAYTRRFHVKHDGGTATLRFEPATELGPTISMIEVCARKPDNKPPAAPRSVEATPGFGECILSWGATDEDDIAGYHVERSKDSGPFERLNEIPLPVRFHVDPVDAGPEYKYRIVAVDVFGNESEASEPAVARPLEKTSLPSYELTVKEGDLSRIMKKPQADVTVPAVFEHNGKRYIVKLRLRGASTRWLAKKGYKIIFPEDSPFEGRRAVNLKAQMGDVTLQQEKLSLDLIGETKAAASVAKYIHLRINGKFAGVYTDIEEMDEDFLQRSGRSLDGQMFRMHSFQELHEPRHLAETLRPRTPAVVEKESAIALIEFVNRAGNGEFARYADRYFNMEQVLDYWCVLALLQRTEIEAGDYFLYRAPDTGLWEFLTWDNNNGNLGIHPFDRTLRFETEGSIFANSIFCVPAGNPYWHTVITRLLSTPRFRERYMTGMRELNDQLLAPGVINKRIDANYASIRRDMCADWHKFPSTDNSAFLESANALKRWARKRHAHVKRAVREKQERPALVISEFLTFPESAGENAEAGGQWIEIANRSRRSVRLDNFHLSNNTHNYRMWRFPRGMTLRPGGHLLVHSTETDTAGGLRANFNLSSDGGEIVLYEIDDEMLTVHDMVFYGRQNKGISYGRISSISDDWAYFTEPSPGTANESSGASDFHVFVVTASCKDGAHVIRCAVLDAPSGSKVTAIVKAQGEYFCVELKPVPDGKDTYEGRLFLPPGAVASCYIVARSPEGIAKTYPLTAPERRLRLIPRNNPDSPVVVSELMASNRKTVRSDTGKYCDWIELHNRSKKPVSLRGMYLTDDPSLASIHPLPADVRIAPGGYMIFWADGSPVEGELHVGFRLKREGETLYLLQKTEKGLMLLDRIAYPRLGSDISYGRNGRTGLWEILSEPTPGRRNPDR
jgi:hypothetical protein